MRLQVLASDYDDTLAREGRIDTLALERIELTRSAGIKVVLVTGRRMTELIDVFPDLSAVDFVVAENGGYAYSPAEDRGWLLAPALDPSLVEALRDGGVSPLYVGDAIVSTLEPCLAVVNEVVSRHPAGYAVIRNRESLMMLPHGIDKGSGLTAALELLGVSYQTTAAVGDAENDISLIAAARLGVAVGDAVDALKAAATLVTHAAGPQGFVELVDALAAADWEVDAIGAGPPNVRAARAC